ncbi:unnamed protein product [Durusdinium trenchii]|uniref:Uncharacterized protein n=1 Tax=Durusdinium trenchii TaxID=1381693 RepID=A0ABP0IFG6_9DINO
MGFVEVLHKPNKKAKDYDPTKRRRRKEIHRELFFEAFPRIGVEPHLVDRPEGGQTEDVWRRGFVWW